MRELSVRILTTYLQQGYIFFVNNNSARLLRGLGSDVSSVYNIVKEMFNLISKALTIICIIIFIIVQAPAMAVFLLLLVVFCFILTQVIFRKPMQKYGREAREYNYRCNQASLEAIQGNKEVLVTNRQKYFIGAASPSYLIEGVCVSGLMLAVAFQITHSDNAYTLISQMAVIAVAAFRILPSLGGILSSINGLVYHAPALSAAYDTLSMVKELEKGKAEDNVIAGQGNRVSFQKELTISKLLFSYPGSEEKIIDNLDMKIRKGTSVAFIGMSGAGKTTLSDLVLGLLKPQKGEILMDGVNIDKLGGNWNKVIGYVPQSIYLTDSTIRKNIAFGIDDDKINDEQVWKVLEMAQLKEFVLKQPKGLDTLVGEWGVKFSGGQRQRVAIARALYGNPDILVLDEATAALDSETETAVMEAIEMLQGYKTLIIVAHRLTTIKNCDVIYEIKEGKAVPREKKEIFPD